MVILFFYFMWSGGGMTGSTKPDVSGNESADATPAKAFPQAKAEATAKSDSKNSDNADENFVNSYTKPLVATVSGTALKRRTKRAPASSAPASNKSSSSSSKNSAANDKQLAMLMKELPPGQAKELEQVWHRVSPLSMA
jgi:hypothetical protein